MCKPLQGSSRLISRPIQLVFRPGEKKSINSQPTKFRVRLNQESVNARTLTHSREWLVKINQQLCRRYPGLISPSIYSDTMRWSEEEERKFTCSIIIKVFMEQLCTAWERLNQNLAVCYRSRNFVYLFDIRVLCFAYSASNRSNSIGMSINMRAELAAELGTISTAAKLQNRSEAGRDKTEKQVGRATSSIREPSKKARSPEIESDKFNARENFFLDCSCRFSGVCLGRFPGQRLIP